MSTSLRGETGLAASFEERKANEQAHGEAELSVSPRKVDFPMLASVEHQRKLVHIEIADYEHKGHWRLTKMLPCSSASFFVTTMQS